MRPHDVVFKAFIRQGQITPFPGIAGKVAVELSRLPQEGPLDVTVALPSKKRTRPQNDRHWSLIVPAFEQLGWETFSQWAEEHGESSKDSAHNVIKRMFLDPLEIVLPDFRVVHVWPSSKSLTTAQFAEMDDKAERYLNNLGVFLPAKEDR